MYTVKTPSAIYRYGIGGLITVATGQITVQKTAGENISAHRPVYVAADDKVYHTTTNNPPTLPILPTQSANSGDTVTVIVYGYIEDSSFNFTPGGLIYMSDTGTLTQTPPAAGEVWELGYAVTQTKIFYFPRLIVEQV